MNLAKFMSPKNRYEIDPRKNIVLSRYTHIIFTFTQSQFQSENDARHEQNQHFSFFDMPCNACLQVLCFLIKRLDLIVIPFWF